jgi:chorismate-pyruvate lyase
MGYRSLAVGASSGSQQDVESTAWSVLDAIAPTVPAALLPWLAEPGLLTERMRAVCGDAMRFRLLGVLDSALPSTLRTRLAVRDDVCLLRDIEFCRGEHRWLFARTVLPASTVAAHPWLRDLGEQPLGEALRRAGRHDREPLEYARLLPDHPLAQVASHYPVEPLWARRAIYRIDTAPLIVQEVFLPTLWQSVA